MGKNLKNELHKFSQPEKFERFSKKDKPVKGKKNSPKKKTFKKLWDE